MTASTTRIRRWDVLWADLDPVVGSEQAGRRPVVIVSNDAFNTYMPVVLAIPLTKLEGKRRPPYWFEVLLPRGAIRTGITSLVLTQQLRAISRRRLRGKLSRITDEASRVQIEARLLDHLGIDTP